MYASRGTTTRSIRQLRSQADAIYAVVGLIADLVVRATIRVRAYGVERIPSQGAALLVANHVSHYDPVVLSVLAYRRGRQVRLLVVKELFDKPLLGTLARSIGWIPVADGRAPRVLADAQEALGRGDLVLIYPEGTIPSSGAIVPARSGAAVIAICARVPVIPIGSDGLERNARPRPWRRRRVTVRVGSPISHAFLAAMAAEAGYAAASELLLTAVRGLAGLSAIHDQAALEEELGNG